MKNTFTTLVVSLATRLLSTPPGGWPETEEAERQLDEVISSHKITRKQALLWAVRDGARLHPSRDLRKEFAEEFASLPAASLGKYFGRQLK